ncbi:enoyl-CoA hydratase [Mycobacterium colombiense]|uniref:enoyl-CoA hydratase-related protein n=1 Tax=Mycobacterium colombiense TaxID=339268 RepID=UPI0007EF14D7|nr:enoyl-CoA hydratase-related protein [Mycobacterium colombiense]OBK68565.1 enoyl-CoA hydratase [Mycobacterium colombiense]
MGEKAQYVDVDIQDNIATVSLNRPPVNALNAAMMREIAWIFRDLGRGSEATVAILTSSQEKVFSAGADLAESERRHVRRELAKDESLADLIDPGIVPRDCFNGVRSGGLPVIAALNGAAVGAGAVLVACCDLIVAAEDAWISLPEITVGVAGGYRHLQRLFGPFKAREMAYRGHRVPASELYRFGAAAEIVPSENLQATARSLAVEIASRSPLALRIAKESMDRAEDMGIEDGYRLEQDYTTRMTRLADSREARNSYREKRRPQWSWR